MIDDMAPHAARLVCGVLERDADETHAALDGLTITQLHALAVLLAASVDPEQPLGHTENLPTYFGTIARITATTAWHTGINATEIYGRSRDRDITDARQIVCWVAAAQGLRSVQIGRALHRDHSTILNATAKITANPALSKVARRVLKDIKKGA